MGLCLSLILWSPLGYATDYVVHVALVDQVGMPAAARLDKYLRKTYRDLDVRTITFDLEGRPLDDDLIAKVRERLAELPFDHGQKVRLLVLNTPAEIDVVEPLTGRLAKVARVVTMGYASAGFGADRMRALGADDGSTFTLVTKPRTRIANGLTPTDWKRIGFTSLTAGVLMAGAAAVQAEYDAIAPVFMATTLNFAVTIATARVLWDRLVPWISVFTRRADYGRITRFENGEYKSDRFLSLLRRRRVFACEDRLRR